MTDPFERAVLREKVDHSTERLHHEQTGLSIHATVYVAVNILLVVIWALTGRGFLWFLFPIFGWGIGLAAHAAAYRAHTQRSRRLEATLHERHP